MQNSKTNIIAVFASIFVAVIVLIAAYIFGWQPSSSTSVEDQAVPATQVQPIAN